DVAALTDRHDVQVTHLLRPRVVWRHATTTERLEAHRLRIAKDGGENAGALEVGVVTDEVARGRHLLDHQARRGSSRGAPVLVADPQQGAGVKSERAAKQVDGEVELLVHRMDGTVGHAQLFFFARTLGPTRKWKLRSDQPEISRL